MYEENQKNSINWMSLLIKGAIIIAVVIIVLIIFGNLTKSDNNSGSVYSSSNSKYRDNVIQMKEAAFEYFTSNKLPKEIGDTKQLTLNQMFDQKLLLDFNNSDENYDLVNSYVKVTKTSDENYALKVLLSNNEYSDYIVTTIEKDKDCIVDCPTVEVPNNNNNSGNNSSNNNNNNSATDKDDSNDTDKNGNSSSNTIVKDVVYNFNFTYPCVDCDNDKDPDKEPDKDPDKEPDKEEYVTYYKHEKLVKSYEFDLCKYESETYYTTSYISSDRKEDTSYSYELKLKNLENIDVDKTRIVASYFGTGTSDYYQYIKTRNDDLDMTGASYEHSVYMTSSTKFRDSSLKSGNFDYELSNLYERNNDYFTKVNIDYEDDYRVDKYYASNLGYNVYFVPVKFNVYYINENDCYQRTASESVYESYEDSKNYYLDNVDIDTRTETKWSTSKSLSGYEYTGISEQRAK